MVMLVPRFVMMQRFSQSNWYQAKWDIQVLPSKSMTFVYSHYLWRTWYTITKLVFLRDVTNETNSAASLLENEKLNAPAGLIYMKRIRHQHRVLSTLRSRTKPKNFWRRRVVMMSASWKTCGAALSDLTTFHIFSVHPRYSSSRGRSTRVFRRTTSFSRPHIVFFLIGERRGKKARSQTTCWGCVLLASTRTRSTQQCVCVYIYISTHSRT